MKKILIIAIALVTVQVTAQDKKENRRMERLSAMQDMSAEDMAQLQTKKMTLDLDLTEAQQEKIGHLNLERAKNRKAKIEARKKAMENNTVAKPSKEERLKIMNERLDAQIVEKKKMKNILNAEQYEKWSKMQEKRNDFSKRNRMHSKNKMQKKE